jgi:parvulin-like peptidyl-prolyl isomerase
MKEEIMGSRIPVWLMTMMLFVFTPGWAYGGEAGQPAAAGEPLNVTIELPVDSPHIQALSPAGIKADSADSIVRLRVPVGSEKLAWLPLAEVGDEPITLGDLRRILVSAGQEEGKEPSPPRVKNPMEVLQRLVELRLIAREGREIGLDELPEVRDLVDVYSRRTLREHLILRRIKGVEADEAEADRLYLEAAREWRIKALIFREMKDAEAFRGEVLAGTDFDEAAGKYLSDGKAEAKGGKEGEFVKTKEVSPEIAERIGGLEAGSVTSVIKTGDGFAVIRLVEARVPESAEARASARRRARNFAQNTALAEYNRQLTDKYVKLDRDLFEKLDFGGSVDNFQRLLEDDRVVAQVEGDEPLKVSQLANGIREQFYHGLGKAIEQGTINDKKIPVLNEIIFKKVFRREALAQGIDNTPEFAGAVADYRDSAVFGAFVERVLRPEIKITRSDLGAYYQEHIDQYTTPAMVRLRSIVFSDASAAQAALDKLKKGTDFRWMKANAEGQVQPRVEEAPVIGEGVVTERSLPEALRQALEGAEEGASVLYRQEGKYFHVVNVEKRVPSRVQSFEDVQQDVGRSAYKEKLERALRDWMERLKNAYDAKVYAKEFSGSAP